ncbi:hypothetical protein DFH08DRAFT_985686 [Mycena albidolilacea]|uniref:Uncharacterized protein n=1 Tax=Mycena albidolilacea TaxID=1033008 RepID=A0AAD6Z333_9AGAR|nr:hypothetical protein DFH08DRAFT_985686 [Mycena albidolilacea]
MGKMRKKRGARRRESEEVENEVLDGLQCAFAWLPLFVLLECGVAGEKYRSERVGALYGLACFDCARTYASCVLGSLLPSAYPSKPSPPPELQSRDMQPARAPQHPPTAQVLPPIPSPQATRTREKTVEKKNVGETTKRSANEREKNMWMRIRIRVRMWTQRLENKEEDSQYRHKEGAIYKRRIENEEDEEGMKSRPDPSSRRSADSFRTLRSACAYLREHHVNVDFTAARTSPVRGEGAEEDTGREERQLDKRMEEDRVSLQARQRQRKMPGSLMPRTRPGPTSVRRALVQVDDSPPHPAPHPPRIRTAAPRAASASATRSPHGTRSRPPTDGDALVGSTSHPSTSECSGTRHAYTRGDPAPAATAGEDPVSGARRAAAVAAADPTRPAARPFGLYAAAEGWGVDVSIFRAVVPKKRVRARPPCVHSELSGERNLSHRTTSTGGFESIGGIGKHRAREAGAVRSEGKRELGS